MSNLEKAKEIVKAYYKNANYGIFNSRNIIGDMMETIYENNGLTIDICYHWSYFEVFGLDEAEFKELERYYYSLNKN
jgi:hypothetical protein